MGYEYKLQAKRFFSEREKKEIDYILRQNPLFCRTYVSELGEFKGKISYEFRVQANRNTKYMPNFEITFIEDGFY